jgi:molybdopterin-guanine dinucleotide biosynthesis protein A
MGGQDKGLIPLAGRPLIAWVIDALSSQVGSILISANRNQAAYAAFGYPVIGDEAGGAGLAGFQGPLAGIAAALTLAETPWLLTLPCDAPLPPIDLAARLVSALTPLGSACADSATVNGPGRGCAPVSSAPVGSASAGNDRAASANAGSNLAVAWDGERIQPVHALLSRALLSNLRAYLEAGERRLEDWQALHHPAIADFSDCPEAFLNLNTPEDVLRLERYLITIPSLASAPLYLSAIVPQ